MGRKRRMAALALAAALGACASADQYREACRFATTDLSEVDDCANRRAEQANAQTALLVVLGAVVVGAIAVAASGGAGSSSKNDTNWNCFPLGCPPMTP